VRYCFVSTIRPLNVANWQSVPVKSASIRCFSSEEIAKSRGSSVNSVDKVMSRLKQKFRALIGAKE
jgi:DNA-directed RNA polymerase specialized sigma24 family protein